jgi:hypothetical protein
VGGFLKPFFVGTQFELSEPVVKPHVLLDVALQCTFAPEVIDGWVSPVTNTRTSATKSFRFATFPKVKRHG